MANNLKNVFNSGRKLYRMRDVIRLIIFLLDATKYLVMEKYVIKLPWKHWIYLSNGYNNKVYFCMVFVLRI